MTYDPGEKVSSPTNAIKGLIGPFPFIIIGIVYNCVGTIAWLAYVTQRGNLIWKWFKTIGNHNLEPPDHAHSSGSPINAHFAPEHCG